jgi:hypothetical protein
MEAMTEFESVPGCYTNYPHAQAPNSCEKCYPELRNQCRLVAANKPKTEHKNNDATRKNRTNNFLGHLSFRKRCFERLLWLNQGFFNEKRWLSSFQSAGFAGFVESQNRTNFSKNDKGSRRHRGRKAGFALFGFLKATIASPNYYVSRYAITSKNVDQTLSLTKERKQ